MRIGIIRYWVGRPAAEHETVERFKYAASQIGHTIVELRADGLDLDGNITEVDFVINLHFASGKSTNVLTYGALWNPWKFYKGWGLSQTFANQISNDFLISCGSEKIDKRFVGEGFPKIIENKLSHTVPDDFLTPEHRTDRKLFYIGVNWEKSSGTRGRHHELLKILDRNNVIKIYGPEKLGDVRPWAGFKNYVGELPFDGKSVFEAASRCGAVLVLSSKDHLEDQIMTSRLFEGIASGAAIIGDSHPFLSENFPNEIMTFDNEATFEDQAKEIIEKLNAANRSPEKTLTDIEQCQKIIKSRFNLASQLEEIVSHAQKTIETKASIRKTKATAVVIHLDGSLINDVRINSLKSSNFNRVIVLSNQIQAAHILDCVEVMQSSNFKTTSDCISYYLSLKDENEFVTFCTGNEEFFDSYLDLADELDASNLGYFVSAARIENHDDHYANICNPLNSPWHSQYLPSLVIRTSALRDFEKYFHSTAIHSLLSDNFFKLRDLGFLKLDHRSGYRVASGIETLGEVQGVDYHQITHEMKNYVFPVSQSEWFNAIQENVRRGSTGINTVIDSIYVYRSIYHQIRLPKFLKAMLKRIALRVLKI